jgi:hypothetical protein
MTWQTFAFLIIAGAAFGYSGYRFSILIKMMKAHRGKGPAPKTIMAELGRRIVVTLVNVLGQKAVLQKKYIGVLHTTIFWGFIIITIGTLEQFVSTIYAPANFEFIGQGAYGTLVCVQDIFTLGVFLAVLGAFYRRLIVRPDPHRLAHDLDSAHERLSPGRRSSLV